MASSTVESQLAFRDIQDESPRVFDSALQSCAYAACEKQAYGKQARLCINRTATMLLTNPVLHVTLGSHITSLCSPSSETHITEQWADHGLHNPAHQPGQAMSCNSSSFGL